MKIDLNKTNGSSPPTDNITIEDEVLTLEEVANQKVAPKRICDSTPTLTHDALEYRRRQANITKRPRICAVCDKTFYARRSDALYCSQRCRQKDNYRKVLKQGSTPHSDR